MTKAEMVDRIIQMSETKRILIDEQFDGKLAWNDTKALVADCNRQIEEMAERIKPFSKCNHSNVDCYHYYGIAPMGQTR